MHYISFDGVTAVFGIAIGSQLGKGRNLRRYSIILCIITPHIDRDDLVWFHIRENGINEALTINIVKRHPLVD